MTDAIYVNHVEPFGRDAPYHIAMVDLTYSGLPGQLEQVWLNPLGDHFRVACIPFCAYGLAYLDEVVLDPDGVFVREVVGLSGNRVLRALVHERREGCDVNPDSVCESLTAIASNLGIGMEMHGDRFLAFDVPRGADVRSLVDAMASWANRKALHYEWSDVRSFAYSRSSG